MCGIKLTGLSGLTLLVGIERLLEEIIAGENHDDGQVLVDEGQYTVLQLTGHDSLAVKIGNFLDLEGTLERSRELRATAEQQQRLLVLEGLLAKLLDEAVLLENLLDLAGDGTKTLHDFLTTGLLGGAVLAKRQREHDHGDELGGVGLGRGDTDLRASVDVDTTVGEEGDGRTDNVDNTNSQGTALQTVSESHQRVSSLTRLRDKDAGVITEDRCLTVEEIRCQLDSDGNFSKLLKDTTNSHARMV